MIFIFRMSRKKKKKFYIKLETQDFFFFNSPVIISEKEKENCVLQRKINFIIFKWHTFYHEKILKIHETINKYLDSWAFLILHRWPFSIMITGQI